MAKITIKQHYVPQSYLNKWVDEDECFYPIRIEDKNPPQLYIFKKKSKPVAYCFENFFYAEHTGIKDDISQVIETEFAEIESIFFNEIPIIEEKILKNKQITLQDKYHLSECMLFFHFKGKKYREQSTQMTDKLVKKINKFLAQDIDKHEKIKEKMDLLNISKQQMIDFADKEEYRVDFGNIHHLAIMQNIYNFCNLLVAKHWKIYISQNGEFLTTDTPFQDKALNSNYWGNDFLSREHVFILNPNIVIVARYQKNKNVKNVIRKDITHNKIAIQKINTLNLMNSIRFGFHKKKEILEDAKKNAYTLFLQNNPSKR